MASPPMRLPDGRDHRENWCPECGEMLYECSSRHEILVMIARRYTVHRDMHLRIKTKAFAMRSPAPNHAIPCQRAVRNHARAQRMAARTEAAVWPNRIARSSAVRMPPWFGLTCLTSA